MTTSKKTYMNKLSPQIIERAYRGLLDDGYGLQILSTSMDEVEAYRLAKQRLKENPQNGKIVIKEMTLLVIEKNGKYVILDSFFKDDTLTPLKTKEYLLSEWDLGLRLAEEFIKYEIESGEYKPRPEDIPVEAKKFDRNSMKDFKEINLSHDL